MMNMGGSGGMGMMNMDMMNMDMMNMGSMQSGMQMGNMGPGGYMQGMQYPMVMEGYGYVDPASLHATVHGANGVGGSTNILGATGFNSSLTGLFNFAINIFAVLLVIGLIVAVVLFLKRYLVEGNASLFTPNINVTCSCGQVLQSQWNCCPKCGQIKAQPVTPTIEPKTV